MIDMPPKDKNIPDELKQLPQWVCWKKGKIPTNPRTGRNASTSDPKTWGTFNDAVDRYVDDKNTLGIGFVFNDNGIAGIDLDKCRDKETGAVEEWAEDIIFSMDSYTEISPSRTGFHIFVKTNHRNIGSNNREKRVEIYTLGRFFTVTGNIYEQ